MAATLSRVVLFVLAVGVADCSPGVGMPVAVPAILSSGAPAASLSSAVLPANVPPGRGRTPAETMSYLGAEWLTRAERIEEEQPDKMLAALDIRPGMAVADIGAGVGYHAFRLSALVGSGGRVYATDIQPEMLAMLQKAAVSKGLNNVTGALSGDTTTGLPKGSIDLALMVDVYHELSQPERFLAALKEALKPSGRLVLVEFRGEDPNVPIKEEHKMTAAQAIQELRAAGFTLTEQKEFLPWQHILIFSASPR